MDFEITKVIYVRDDRQTPTIGSSVTLVDKKEDVPQGVHLLFLKKEGEQFFHRSCKFPECELKFY